MAFSANINIERNMQQVELYTKGYCPYCKRAKSLLTSKGVNFTDFEIDKQPELRDPMIARANGKTTVPQIFIGETHVGGCDDLFALESSGKLDSLLNG
jgi:glutaredoxin 3